MQVNESLQPSALAGKLERFWKVSAEKIRLFERDFPADAGAPVFTVAGKYTARGWTEWTEGFRYGSMLLQYDADGENEFLESGRKATLEKMPGHVTDFGVHDHGFNIISTYGNLRRLALEGKLEVSPEEVRLYELALANSGTVQAKRWAKTASGGGYIYSFNGKHSLFADTIRSLRSLAVAYSLGAVLHGEQDARISLLERLVRHAETTARYTVYYGEGRDAYDVRGRVAHESLFNPANGEYRCPSTQQGYSPFSTWTRGLAWVMLGFAEQLEFLRVLSDDDIEPSGGREKIEEFMYRAASATCNFYIENTAADGIPYWDTGAPGLEKLENWRARRADPFNDHEPVDSSAAPAAAQALLRMGKLYREDGDKSADAARWFQAGLTVLDTLFDEPYLCADDSNQGLILHAVYHRPNGWDYVPAGKKIPCGEACMWGDYHAREVALYLGRLIEGEQYYTFFGPMEQR